MSVLENLVRPTIFMGELHYVGGRMDRMEASLDEMKVQMTASLAAVKIDVGKAMARQDSLETWITAQVMQHRENCGGLVTK